MKTEPKLPGEWYYACAIFLFLLAIVSLAHHCGASK